LLHFETYTRGMEELVTIAVVVTAVAVLTSFGFGFRALHLAKTHSEAASLRLIALNLLEPSVTVGVLFVVFAIAGGLDATDDSGLLLMPLLAGVPLTAMLLAPLWTRIANPIRSTLIVYGVLRWINTLALWASGVLTLNHVSSNDWVNLAAGLILSGTLILCLSVSHLASSLSGFRQLKPTHS
jgi:hypothetical protein